MKYYCISEEQFCSLRNPVFSCTNKLLGKGSYGQVFEAQIKGNSEKIAVKCASIDCSGIPNLLEASIMSGILHPYINKTLATVANDQILFLFQEKALGDVSQYLKENSCDMITIKKWLHQISQAINCLHSQNIIHGDIKANNILVYSDLNVKITDFSLSVKKWSPTQVFNKSVCTNTHRPPESYLGASWDEKVDIWSLGCTFHEIYYSQLFVPSQIQLLSKNLSNEEIRRCLRQMYIRMFSEYYKTVLVEEINNLPFYSINTSCIVENTCFNELLRKIFSLNPSNRPSIREILNNNFFNNFPIEECLLIINNAEKLSVKEEKEIFDYLKKLTDDNDLIILAYRLYIRCLSIKGSKELILATCLFLASKLIKGIILSLPYHEGQLFPMERTICHTLKFRLHTVW